MANLEQVVTICVHDRNDLSRLGELPDDVRALIWDATGDPPDGIEQVQFWAPGYMAALHQDAAYAAMPELKVVQLVSAGADAWADTVPEGVSLCDGRGVHGSSTSEWVLTAILCALREFPRFVLDQAKAAWDPGRTDELAGKHVIVIGAGDLGTQVVRRLTAFDATATLVARRARDGVRSIDELDELLPTADVVVLVVPLTPATTGLVDAAFLDRMRAGALLVNAARGPVADTDALVAALRTGRIHAALDVTDPEPLPDDHPLWTAPNVLITPHVGGNVVGLPARAAALVRAQLERFAAGDELENVVSDGY